MLQKWSFQGYGRLRSQAGSAAPPKRLDKRDGAMVAPGRGPGTQGEAHSLSILPREGSIRNERSTGMTAFKPNDKSLIGQPR